MSKAHRRLPDTQKTQCTSEMSIRAGDLNPGDCISCDQWTSNTDPLFADRLETALRVSQSREGLWGKLGNLLCLLPPLPRDVTVSSAQGGLSYVLGSGVSKIFAWMFVLCSVGASRRCYLGMSDSHLLLSQAGSG